MTVIVSGEIKAIAILIQCYSKHLLLNIRLKTKPVSSVATGFGMWCDILPVSYLLLM